MKYLQPARQNALNTHITTECFLLLITPQNAPAFGVTSLDVDIDYNDGDGVVTYQAVPGANVASIETSGDLQVDNSEAMLLIDTDFSREDIAAGVLDYATFKLYRINWLRPFDGHITMQTGRTGIVTSNNTLSGVIELRGIPQQLKQNFVDLYSLTCRAQFGSTTGEEPFPCMYNTDSLWQTTTVATVGTESDRVFTSTATPAATGPNGALNFNVALIEWLTGDNAGLQVETEIVTGTSIELRFGTAYTIQVGDSFKIRPDCQKRYDEDCIALYANGQFFRGEPHIPLTEENPSGTPGAGVGGVGGFSSYRGAAT